ncbi:hypothetical protein CSE16_08715 [Solibacillus sp. R5-41]|nr:hypothetical protein CSE16_08715 [Solibacillus sp. R5-41]
MGKLQIESGEGNPTKKKQLKATVSEHREPLVDMYLEYFCEELFEDFNDVAVVAEDVIVPIPPTLANTGRFTSSCDSLILQQER